MSRYLRVYWAFFKNSLIREMQFRGHFWIYSLINLIWAGLAMMTFLFIFNQVSQVQGWTLQSMLLLTATFYFFDRVFATLFEDNFYRFNYLINHGDLDLVLSKPLSSQFIVSLRRVSIANLIGAVTMLGAVVFLVRQNFWPVPLINLFIYGFLLSCAVVIVYSLWFMTLNLVFWVGNVDNIRHLFRPLYEVVRIPIDVTGLVLRPFLTYFLPLAFVATIPVKALTGSINGWLVLFGLVAAAFWLAVSRLVWRQALKHYSSASS